MGLQRRLVGVGTGSLKYDLLTAIGLIGLHGSAMDQTSMTRLIVVVTARYNWARDELSIGQRDMARMWSVNERTAKREVKRWMDAEILTCQRPGVRGRVAAYRLNLGEICSRSRPAWTAVGPDFADRMAQLVPAVGALRVDVVPLQPACPGPTASSGRWSRVLSQLEAVDRPAFDAWFSKLELVCDKTAKVRVKASSPFVGRYIETHLSKRLLPVLAAVYGPSASMEISASAS